MSVQIKMVNFIRNKRLKHWQFDQLMKDNGKPMAELDEPE